MHHIELHSAPLRRFYAHLNSAVRIVELYDGQVPFASFIKNYFAQHKKYGSKDRRQITELCYGYFRLGASYTQLSILDKILKGFQLSQEDWPDEWLGFFKHFELPAGQPDNIFAFKNELSAGIEADAFEQSHLQQPDLFLRIRPGYEEAVEKKLTEAAVPHRMERHCVRLSNSLKAGELFTFNKEVVVQDRSSQRVSELLRLYASRVPEDKWPVRVWDCCAASGGKSILAVDVLNNIQLTVSDIRPSIMANLKNRFAAAGLTSFDAFVADTIVAAPENSFDLIIADVPCTGSGTWARTPEQLTFFRETQIAYYADLQAAIVTNTVKYLKPGGHFLYITCSVFKKENEAQLETLKQLGLTVISEKLLAGYHQQADSMYAVLLSNQEYSC